MHAVSHPSDLPDERALVIGLRAGQATAFDALYAAYARRIYGFLYRLSGRRDLADDLSQEHWLRVARHAVSLREDTDLGAWMFTIARNLYRGHQRFAIFDRLRGRDAIEADHAPSPERDATARQALAQLERALGRLSPAHREILLLVGAEGLEPTRAAEVLGQKPEATRQRLLRARAALTQALERGKVKTDE